MLRKQARSPRYGKKEKRREKCNIVLYAQNEGSHWYVDSSYFKHMSGDKSKFLTWKLVEKGNATLDNNAPGKIVGK